MNNNLPKITDESWVLPCESITHKQQMLDYATAKGVPTLAGPVNFEDYGGPSYRDDADLQIAYCDTSGTGFPSGLMSVGDDDSSEPITVEQFKAMCDAHKA